MDVKLNQSIMLKLSKLEANKGQIEGLPKNPRIIKDDKFRKLVNSIEDNPEMTSLREILVYPYGDKFVVIGGNMRLKAMKELGYKEAPCKIIPEETTVEQLKAYTIKDNSGFGEWDFDMLMGEWDFDLLADCAIDVPVFDESIDGDYSEKAAQSLSNKMGDSVLKIELTPRNYAKVVESLNAFSEDLSVAIMLALGLDYGDSE